VNRILLLKAVDAVMLITGFFCFLAPAAAAETVFEIKIDKAVYLRTKEGPKVSVSGETNLPRDAVVSVFVKKDGNLTAFKDIPVSPGKYYVTLGPLDKQLSGKYDIQVLFSPEKQSGGVANWMKANVPGGQLKNIEASFPLDAGEEGEEKSPYGIEISDSIEQYGNRIILHIDGKTGLPDWAVLKVFLKRIDNVIAMGESVAMDGSFSISFGPFGSELAAGKYKVEVVFIPDMQRPDFKKTISNGKIPYTEVSRDVVIGKASEAAKNEKSEKNDTALAVSSVEELYKELKDVYALSSNDFNAATWDEWSDRWRFRVKKLSNSLKNSKKGNAAVLYPECDKDLPIAIRYLSEIYVIMTDSLKARASEVNEAKKADMEKKRYAIEMELQKLVGSMNSELSSAPKEVD